MSLVAARGEDVVVPDGGRAQVQLGRLGACGCDSHLERRRRLRGRVVGPGERRRRSRLEVAGRGRPPETDVHQRERGREDDLALGVVPHGVERGLVDQRRVLGVVLGDGSQVELLRDLFEARERGTAARPCGGPRLPRVGLQVGAADVRVGLSGRLGGVLRLPRGELELDVRLGADVELGDLVNLLFRHASVQARLEEVGVEHLNVFLRGLRHRAGDVGRGRPPGLGRACPCGSLRCRRLPFVLRLVRRLGLQQQELPFRLERR